MRKVATDFSVPLCLALTAGLTGSCTTAGENIQEISARNQSLSCEHLADQPVESGKVLRADRFAKGSQMLGGVTPEAFAATDMCRVSLLLEPTSQSQIHVEIWLPENWNERMLGLGGGGFDGSLSAGSAVHLNRAIEQGYVAIATDAGHPAGAPAESWVHQQPERIKDFAFRGQHLAAVTAKQIIELFYGRSQDKALFLGCSNGGRDGLMLAQRYPADYDAIVAGAPAQKYTEVVTQLIWNSESVGNPSEAAMLTKKLPIVHAAILEKCDRIDGVADGILENPKLCKFKPSELKCTGGDSSQCLSQAEIDALDKVYSGTQFSDGTPIYQGPSLGSEGSPGNWAAWVTGPVPAMAGQEFYRWMVFDDPTWTIEQFDLDQHYRVAREKLAPVLNADNPDLRAFAARGGKLLMYQGWDDPAITPSSTINYFEAVRRTLGPSADDALRLFMVPGMAHCGGGPGTTSFDMQAALERWIETDEPPARVSAKNPDATDEQFTRPLCPWPQTAHYKGSGSIKEASNFVCRK